jgi:aryl-alcohol dehydrogenase-like predicted oxidoreductase
MSQSSIVPAAAAGTVAFGDLVVNRMGFGAMRLTGPGIWGPPKDPVAALATLRRAVELGVQFLDTADSYGPFVSEEMIAEALFPYPSGVVVSTKGGWLRIGPGQWIHNASPKHLMEAVEGSLKRLRLDCIPVYQLHVPDLAVSFEASVEALATMREQGKIRHIALSNVTKEHLDRALKIAPIVSVQNRYGFADREWDYLLDYCEELKIVFIPWSPLSQGQKAHEVVERIAQQRQTSTQTIALAWLLQRSPVMLPIPGTSSIAHLEENTRAAAFQLAEDEFEELSQVNPPYACLRT